MENFSKSQASDLLRRAIKAVLLIIAISGTINKMKDATAGPAEAIVQVDGGVQHQIMDGLGSTFVRPGFTRPGMLPHNIPNSVEQEIYKVFHTDLGFSRMRVAVGVIEPENDNRDPKVFDWTKFLLGVLDDAGHRAYIKSATAYGLTNWFSIANTDGNSLDEPWMLEERPNGGAGAPRNKVKDGMEEEYAEYILAQVVYWKNQGVLLPYTGIMNEPTSWSGGISLTTEQMVKIVIALGKGLKMEGLSTKIHLSDELNLEEALPYMKAVLADPEARKYVGALSYHAYEGVYADKPADEVLALIGDGNTPRGVIATRNALKQLSKQYGIPAWMTEVSGVTGIEHKVGLATANHAHDEFTLGDTSGFDPQGFIGYIINGQTDSPNELIEVSLDAQGNYISYEITKVGYMLSQYAKYVRPGDMRIDANSSDKKVRVTAFRNPQTSSVKVVVINNHRTEMPIRVMLKNTGNGTLRVTGQATSATDDRKPVSVAVRNNSEFTAVLMPESVSSFEASRYSNQRR